MSIAIATKNCPLCNSQNFTSYVYPPYQTCVNCQHTCLLEPPDKTWMNPGDGNSNGYSGAIMNEGEKTINRQLATWLYTRYRPRTSIDIGCGHPYFAQCFQDLGARAMGIDGGFKDDLINLDGTTVPTCAMDWEMDNHHFTNIDMITMVHVFEHFYNPYVALKKVYDTLSDDGVLYVRSPNKDVKGIERDHTPGHVLIHPHIYGTESLQYVMKKAGFHLIWMDHTSGYGQTSWIFKKRPPKVSLFMIVKNEEHNIGECLATVRDFCDEIIVLDTGSTDLTVFKSIEAGAEVYHSKWFNKDTQYKDFHFANARNEAMAYATGDWLFWMDADDLFSGKLVLKPEHDAYHIKLIYGNSHFQHARAFRRGWMPQFYGAIHETPDISGCRTAMMATATVTHKVQPKQGRVQRNLDILESELAREPDNKRTMWYLANAYSEVGRWAEALAKYRRYLKLGGNFHDEIVLTHYYVANCLYMLGEYAEAIRQCFNGLCVDDRYAEFFTRIGESYVKLEHYQKAIPYFLMASKLPFPPTSLWYRKELYNEVPKHYLALCYEKLGDYESAKLYASGDQLDKLSKKQYVIEVVRPGALGDIIATTPALEALRRANPEAHIRFICHNSGFELLRDHPDIDSVIDTEGPCDKRYYFQYPMHEGYPHVPMRKHLAEYFADSVGVKLSPGWKCVLPEIGPLSKETIAVLELFMGDIEARVPADIITFAVKTGWSRYKEWPLERWAELIRSMPSYQWVQIGKEGEPPVPGANYTCGKTSLRDTFRLMSASKVFIGLDSVFNHAANALSVPAVILFGSTSPIGSGYSNATNLWSNYECSPCYIEDNTIAAHKKAPCPFAHKCMQDYMTVDRVREAVIEKLTNLRAVQ